MIGVYKFTGYNSWFTCRNILHKYSIRLRCHDYKENQRIQFTFVIYPLSLFTFLWFIACFIIFGHVKWLPGLHFYQRGFTERRLHFIDKRKSFVIQYIYQILLAIRQLYIWWIECVYGLHDRLAGFIWFDFDLFLLVYISIIICLNCSVFQILKYIQIKNIWWMEWLHSVHICLKGFIWL